MRLAAKSILPYLIILAIGTFLFSFAMYKDKNKIIADNIKKETRATANALAKEIAKMYPTTTMDSFRDMETVEIEVTNILNKYLALPNAAYGAVFSLDRNVSISLFKEGYNLEEITENIFSISDIKEYKYDKDLKLPSGEELYEISVPVVIPKTYFKQLESKEKMIILSDRETKKYNFPEFIEQLAFVVKYSVTLKNIDLDILVEKKVRIPLFIVFGLLLLAIVYSYEETLFRPLSKLVLVTRNLDRSKELAKFEIKSNDEIEAMSDAVHKMYESFLKSIEDLHLTNDYAQSLISSSTISSLFSTIVLEILKLKSIEKGGLLYWNEKRKRFVVKETKNFNDVHKLIANDGDFIKWFLENRTVLDADDFIKNFNIYNKAEAQRWRQYGIEVVVPMFMKDNIVGIITLGKLKSLGEYTVEDMEFLKSVAQVAGIAIENLNLRSREAQNLIIKKDMNFAKSVQQKLLPSEMPNIAGVEFAATSSPARNIGGDYYDFIPLVENTVGICIADVSGKGVPAALVMAGTRSYLRLIAKDNYDCSDILGRVNNLITEDTNKKMFVTMFYSIFDMSNNAIYFANAGHNFPYHYKKGEKAVHLEAVGFPLGMMEGIVYEPKEAKIESGDMLVFYTDGIIEAFNSKEEMFGFDRLELMINKLGDLGAQEFLDRFMREFKVFIGEEELSDDYTLMVVKIL